MDKIMNICIGVSKLIIFTLALLGILIYAFFYASISCVVGFIISFFGIIDESYVSVYKSLFKKVSENDKGDNICNTES